MKCPQCSFENRDGVRFCEECGENLAIQTPQPAPPVKPPTAGVQLPRTAIERPTPVAKPEAEIRCPSCGFSNRPNLRFCEECGERLAVQSPQSAPPVKPPTAAVQPTPAVLKRPTPVTKPAADVRCPSCGFINRPNLRFCEQCGTPLGAHPRPTQAPLKRSAPKQASLLWLTASHKWFIAAALLCMLLIVAAGVWVVRLPNISKSEAVEAAEWRLQLLYPDLQGVQPVIRSNDADGARQYIIEYTTNTQGNLPEKIIFIVDAESGETLMLGSH